MADPLADIQRQRSIFARYVDIQREDEGGFGKEYSRLGQRGIDASPRVVTARPTMQFNRYDDILPVAATIVRIYDADPVAEEASSGKLLFINANHVETDGVAYIAAQGPLAKTVGHFWTMVWQQGVECIVMLGMCKEGSVDKVHRYWPALGGTTELAAAGLAVDCVGEEYHRSDAWVVRTFELYPLGGSARASASFVRTVRHFQLTAWRDHSTPSPKRLAAFLRAVNAAYVPTPTAPPVLVHCSAGVGRSGVFIVLRTLVHRLRLAADAAVDTDAAAAPDVPDSDADDRADLAARAHVFPLPPLFDVRTLLWNMRRQRAKMVQTPEQYAFCHDFLLRNSTRYVGFDFSTYDA